MEILRFTGQGRKIDRYGSVGASDLPIIQYTGRLSVVSIQIEAHGRLGTHPASADQLFLVTSGEGHVSSDNQDEFLVGPRSAVL